ncbi:CPCC family cysteine-rich protein [Cupriavidus sp. YR651]|uniref:CPCC family cysteine-rich protein n=1 Tax=Cupriavidus sp. YR651 TaxID=1855315 RepID=UPI000B8505B5|nr:CPCC family cysteine-rich protein [Cupriavidus sp. YR651]
MSHFPCPCCGNFTLNEISGGTFEICHVCFWEDDQIQLNYPDIAGGANKVSLKEARENYKRYGAIVERFVDKIRQPNKDELPESR